VVVAAWYGHMDTGAPFHGSIVRGLDATNPNSIRVLGEAQLGGWVRDTRVVGDVLYAVSEEYSWWSYGWADGLVPTGSGVAVASSNQQKVVVSSVSFAGGVIKAVSRRETPGYGGIFNVTPNAIMFAHNVQPPNTAPNQYVPSTQMALDYFDISDPGGTITQRGEVPFVGQLDANGTDNGRWNLDFADGKTAHLLGRDVTQNNNGAQGYVLATADFTNPDAPLPASTLSVPGAGWQPAVRFDKGRMYLAPSDGYFGGGNNPVTPIQIFDIADPKAPRLAGQTDITGSVWNFTPSGDGTRLFALGNEQSVNGVYTSQISLRYVDVTNPAQPAVIGTSVFGQGQGWTSTPAAGTFKAFTKNDADGLVVLPFSGWSRDFYTYNNGVQLIEFTPTSIRTSGAAHTKGWVERGIFAHGSSNPTATRLLSLSDLSLAVVDYSIHDAPKITYELPLARNIVDARPASSGTIAQLSSDWDWTNDQDHSQLRVLPIADAEENQSEHAIHEVDIAGSNARVFHDGANLSYVVSNVRRETPCNQGGFSTGGGDPGAPGTTGTPQKCYRWGQQIQVVEFNGAKAVLRGKIAMPDFSQNYGWYYGGWYGCYYYDWYGGADIVQVGGNKLAFRRWIPQYGPNYEYVDAYQSLYIVDLSNPDAPNVASTVVTRDPDVWWGNMRAIGDTLYTTHYEWLQNPAQGKRTEYLVKYYLDRIDLTDPHAPRIGSKVNVPGMLVGGSETDPSIIYTIDYRWYSDDENHGANEFDVLKLVGDKAYLQSAVQIPGWVGNTFVRGNKAYMSVQQYVEGTNYRQSYVRLNQLDLTQPKNIVRTESKADKGWGWLLGVEGDRALVTSGWGNDGLDIYKLSAGAPQFDQTVRTLGWGASSMARQGDKIFLASGQWGVQTIDLK
jgi:hypothetical protein